MSESTSWLHDPAVVTVGARLFDDALTAQGATTVPVEWRPPAGGTEDDLARIAADPRVEAANAEAVRRLTEARPHVVGVRRAGDVLGIEGPQFLHAGPPIDWERASGPMRGALIGGLLFEDLADTAEAAEGLAAGGGVELAPCHSRGAVGPMAGVVTPSMPVFELHDEVNGTTAWCSLNEGLGKVLRYGAFSDEVITRLRWMRDVLGPLLAMTFDRIGPYDVRAMIAQGLQMGDEGHNRNRAGTSLFIREVVGELIEVDASASDIADVCRFVNGNDHFVLNLVMPCAKAAADAARDLPGSTMVVAMARNGTDFGVQVSGTGDEWFTAPAETPKGLTFPGYTDDDVNPDIGDSTITETYGIGGMAMACAPAIVRFVGGTVDAAFETTHSMYDVTLTEHPHLQIPALDFRGTPTGIDATAVVRASRPPAVNTGMAGKVAGTGQVGAGLVTPPMDCFVDAVRALAAAVPD
ncbi:MAG: DUF1116 domain-containing protein [Actinomycetota bacterium]